ncbi:hypothetical protein AMET1_1470 [Methanonatronarchaeum thermophilum]|uniref:DUF1638 domain-containing protein n=1 Tax=Methanonatronarchaeum thermophilum TaxID=1927129 RepID=A0A1Y3GAS2_9EURY|nr:DUF1638 domain-containing protein [Methanonatronarchaeum thermophilum]OUJ18551.1 hypothetical protein AMET1_1470 [Methanonatronarchaeum thermophilum]
MQAPYGVVCCELLEDELAYILNRDSEIQKTYLILDESGDSIIDKLEIDYESISFSSLPTEIKDGEVIVVMMSMALHEEPENLKKEVKNWVGRLSQFVDDVFLFYGLCGNALKKIDEIDKEVEGTLDILRDSTGIVDDCICLALGGTDKYVQYIKKDPATFFLTPMWADNWRDMFIKCKLVRDLDNIELAKKVFENAGYNKVLKIDTGIIFSDGFDEKVREFSKTFELDIEKTTTNKGQELLVENYSRFKENLD